MTFQRCNPSSSGEGQPLNRVEPNPPASPPLVPWYRGGDILSFMLLQCSKIAVLKKDCLRGPTSIINTHNTLLLLSPSSAATTSSPPPTPPHLQLTGSQILATLGFDCSLRSLSPRPTYNSLAHKSSLRSALTARYARFRLLITCW